METAKRESRSLLAVNLGLVANILLAALKTSAGILGHSPALLADGINSTSDVAYYLVVRVFMGLARKPADDEHPYGHQQLENIAALVVGAFVLTTAVTIFWDAVDKVYDQWARPGGGAEAAPMTLAIALFTVAIKVVLTEVTRRIGRQTHNPAVFALAYDHRNDIFAAAAASLGIFMSRLGYAWMDPLAGALVALVILRTGLEILRESSKDLMDTLPGRELHDRVVAVTQSVAGVEQVEEILAHRFGPSLVVNVTIGIDGALSVAEGDRIATRVEHILQDEIDFLERVHVHYHPARDGRPPSGASAAGEAS